MFILTFFDVHSGNNHQKVARLGRSALFYVILDPQALERFRLRSN